MPFPGMFNLVYFKFNLFVWRNYGISLLYTLPTLPKADSLGNGFPLKWEISSTLIASITSWGKLYLSISFCKVRSWTPDTLFGTNCYLLHTHSAFSALRNSFEMNKWSICWKGKWIVHMNDSMVVNLPCDIDIKWGFLFAWETLSFLLKWGEFSSSL